MIRESEPLRSDAPRTEQAALVTNVEPPHPDPLLGAAALRPEHLTSRQLLQLQRAVGNRATSRIAAPAGRLLQRTPDPKLRVPFAVRFDTPLTRAEFIRLADSQLGLDPGKGEWANVRDHYDPADSPVIVQVAIGLVKSRRSQVTATEVGLELDAGGGIAGAGERAAELATLGAAEKQQLYDEIDRRYWTATGLPEGEKIESRAREPGKVALWEQVRDEVLAQRAFVRELPAKARQIMNQSADGVVIGPEHYAQIVRIANKIEQMDMLDLENYLTAAEKTRDLSELEKAVDRFMTAKAAAPQRLEKLIEKTTEGRWDVDTEAAALDAGTLFYLPLDRRLEIIAEIAGGTSWPTRTRRR